MKQLIVVIFFSFFTAQVFGQTVLLEMDKTKETQIKEERNGQNLPRFTQAYFRLGAVLPPDEKGAKLVFGSSLDFSFGVRRKYKVTSFYSLGFEWEITWTDYKLKQANGKIFPDTLLNDRERFDVSSLGINFFNRFNFDPGRGNTIGKYLDLAIRGQYTYGEIMRKNNLPDGSKIKSINTGLPYLNHFHSYVIAKIGVGHFAVYGSYRLNDFFKKRYNYPEMPRVIAGLEIGLY